MDARRYANGFTLLDSAVMVVIVGFVMAGVLKAQTLISTARVRNLISQQAEMHLPSMDSTIATVPCQVIMSRQARVSFAGVPLVSTVMAATLSRLPMAQGYTKKYSHGASLVQPAFCVGATQ